MIPFLVAGEPQRSPGQDTTSRSPDPWVSLQRGAEVEVRHPYAGSLQQTGPEGGNPTAEAVEGDHRAGHRWILAARQPAVGRAGEDGGGSGEA